jgi:DNA-binding NarL/FixJ family response regulator
MKRDCRFRPWSDRSDAISTKPRAARRAGPATILRLKVAMPRAILVAGSRSALAALTSAVSRIEEVEIVRYANGRSDIGALVRRFAADLILLDERRRSAVAIERIADVQHGACGAAVIVLAPWSAGWVPEALRAGVAAVLPVDVDPGSLATVIHEVLAPRALETAAG